MSVRRIVCATDFSPSAASAVVAAARLAARQDADLVIAHVTATAAVELPVPTDLARQLIDDATRGLAGAVREAMRAGATRASSRLLEGVPWEGVLEAARAERADLIVTGTRGRTGIRRAVLGSVAEKIVRHAPCSVLAVHEGDEVDLSDVLCPIDYSDDSRRALELAADLTEPGGRGITLLHVIEAPTTYGEEPSLAAFVADLTAASSRRLDEWTRELRARTTVPVEARCSLGSPAARVLAELDDEPRFGLVVVGSRGRTGLRRALLGSVAEKLVRHARCAVLVAR
jgi:nucleotide-binding universal stress UspA family protein